MNYADACASAAKELAKIAWINRSRIIGLPANPDTARRYSDNLNLDEHPKSSIILDKPC